MPTISFISPKGGVGKTTAATILAVELASKAKVIVIDADPNRPIETWAKLGNMPANIEIVADANQENILDKIEEAARRAPFVVVDCEGTASLTVAYAIGASDLVIVPSQGSQLDAKQAAKAISLHQKHRKAVPALHSPRGAAYPDQSGREAPYPGQYPGTATQTRRGHVQHPNARAGSLPRDVFLRRDNSDPQPKASHQSRQGRSEREGFCE